MNNFELNDSLAGMVCFVDSREQDTPFLRARIAQIGVPVERKKLNFGDYSAKFPLPDGTELDLSDSVAIERKMSFDELANCFCNGRNRFSAEFNRAKESNAKLYLLIENGTWENAYSGKYRSRMSSQAFVASMLAWLARYNCQLLMCSPKTSGKLIHDILYREGKERLEHL